MSETAVLTISRDGDHLLKTWTDQGAVKNFPESETQFYAPSVEGRINFDVDNQRQVAGLVLRRRGNRLDMPRIDAGAAQQIETFVADKTASQAATPGSEAALRSLIEGLVSGNPNYSQMSGLARRDARTASAIEGESGSTGCAAVASVHRCR